MTEWMLIALEDADPEAQPLSDEDEDALEAVEEVTE
tara:strand:- start:344 stop:451 length:108 start_codon:yes stop_codon:yes gene_type:complete